MGTGLVISDEIRMACELTYAMYVIDVLQVMVFQTTVYWKRMSCGSETQQSLAVHTR